MYNESEIIEKITHEKQFLDIKDYSHNIITLLVEMYYKKQGLEKTNKLLKELGLDELGWIMVKK